MTEHLKAACDFLKSVGCTNILAKDSPDPHFGKIKAELRDRPIVARVQLKPEWGLDRQTSTGKNWADARYPYKSVQFILPTPSDGPNDHTHYILVAADNCHTFLCPAGVVDNVHASWAPLRDDGLPDNVNVRSASVENWTPRTGFYICKGGVWGKDANNVWSKPVDVPVDADEFLAQLRGE